jgi:hypothetical protein
MDDKKLKNLDVLKTQIPELDENRLESIWNINPMALVLTIGCEGRSPLSE